MPDAPSLLVHPSPIRGEGPQGYFLRLACENQLRTSDLTTMGIHFDVQSLVTNGLLGLAQQWWMTKRHGPKTAVVAK